MSKKLSFGIIVIFAVILIFIGYLLIKQDNSITKLPNSQSNAQADIWIVKFKQADYLKYYSALIGDNYKETGKAVVSYSSRPIGEEATSLDNSYYLIYGWYIAKGNSFVLVNKPNTDEVGIYLVNLPYETDNYIIKDMFSEWYICDKVNHGVNEGIVPENLSRLYNGIIKNNELSVKCKKVIYFKHPEQLD